MYPFDFQFEDEDSGPKNTRLVVSTPTFSANKPWSIPSPPASHLFHSARSPENTQKLYSQYLKQREQTPTSNNLSYFSHPLFATPPPSRDATNRFNSNPGLSKSPETPAYSRPSNERTFLSVLKSNLAQIPPPTSDSCASSMKQATFQWSDLKNAHLLCFTNIPWDLTTKEVMACLKGYHIVPFGIHIMMDRSTDSLMSKTNKTLGKTMPDAFVELESAEQVQHAIATFHRSFMKNRQVSVRKASMQQLMQIVFPQWSHSTDSRPEACLSDKNYGRVYLTRDEISALISVCKNYKLHYSRKCADRPFENIMSIIRCVPWDNPTVSPSTLHRDHLFELFKVALDALRMHLSKDYHHVSTSLLNDFVSVGVQCPGFTERQKLVILQSAGIEECPDELKEYLEQSVANSMMNRSTGSGNDNNINLDSLNIVDKQADKEKPVHCDEDIMNYYRKELSRWQSKCRVLEEKLATLQQR